MSGSTLNRSNLGYLGVDFQYRLISAFFIEPSFFTDLNMIIDQNMFTDKYLRGIVGSIKEYYKKYGCVPSYGMLEIKLNETVSSEDERKFYTETIEKIKNVPSDGYIEIEAMAEKFFMQQNIIRVANQLKMIAGDGDISKYEECRKLLEDALAIGRHCYDNEWHPFDSIDDDLSAETIVSIPTGIDKLDDLLGGGLDKGKIGIIICPTGKGKTSLTTCISGNAAKCRTPQNDYKGYKVLQIIFEDRKRDMNRKYISKLSQVETIKLNENTEQETTIKEMLANDPDREIMNHNITIKKLPSGEFTATAIKEEIKKKMNQGFKPDLVIVDYFECIKPEAGTTRDDITYREGTTMRKFETMAEELDIAMWIPTQGNRSSVTAEIVTEDKIGGSFKKNEIAQVVISIARNTEDMQQNKATIALLKNRSGAVATLNGVYFNNGTCTVNTSNVIKFDTALGYNEFVQEEKEREKEKRFKASYAARNYQV
jgi:RecA/RadA recombinase